MMFDNMKYKNDLKIVVDNLNKQEENEILIIESGDLGGEDNIDSNDDKQKLNDVNAVEMESETEETEFHVNLDKVPLSLKNTILGTKLYINDSYEKEKIDDIKQISDNDLKSMYESLNIDDNSFIESTFNLNYYRKDALHLYGVDEMNTNEIFEYFNGYKPFEIEWINDKSCNVVWKDVYLLSLAIIELSKPYVDEDDEKQEAEEVKDESSKNEIQKQDISDDSKLSTPVAADKAESEEEIQIETDAEQKQGNSFKQLTRNDKWRIGAVSKQGNQIFMRYAKISDKKVKGAESRSEYYRKYGNPNYNNMRGLISNSKRTKLKSDIFKKYINADDEDILDDDTFETKIPKELMSRLKIPNDKMSNEVKSDKSQRRMRMYIDDNDAVTDKSNKRKRYDDDDDDNSNSNDSYERGKRRSRSPKIIRKPVDARTYIKMKNSTRSDNSTKSYKTDLRDKLKRKY